MNENINLCELLKGHEGEEFYSPIYGRVKLINIIPDAFGHNNIITNVANFGYNGKWSDDGECMIFPSKEQRDWNKWVEKQKAKIPKTWSELCLSAQVEQIEVSTDVIFDDNDKMIDKSHAVGANSKIAKSALALLKIHQLIEVGYGGNINKEEWSSLKEVYSIEYDVIENEMIISKSNPMRLYSHISFHTEKQAEEFMSYPENVQLLKDYYMI